MHRFLVAEAFAERIVEQSCFELCQQHTAYGVVKHSRVEYRVGNQAGYFGKAVARRFHIESCHNCLPRGLGLGVGCIVECAEHFDGAPVGIHISFKFPFVAEQLCENVVRSRVWLALPRVVGRHNGHYRQCANHLFKRIHIYVEQFACAAVHSGEIKPSRRIAVRAEVFQHRRDSVVKIALYLAAGKSRVKEGVFAVGFLNASPAQVAHDVDAGRKHLVDSLIVKIAGGSGRAAVCQIGIEGRGKSYVLRKDGRPFVD